MPLSAGSVETKRIRKLSDAQVEPFDMEYVEGRRWLAIRELIQRDFPDGDFTLLDVGGGNGRFADRILAEFPNSVATVLDNSESLLSRNAPNPRKTVIRESVENLASIDGSRRFDIVCFHWLLHHLVSDSYRRTSSNQLEALKCAKRLLTPRGRISVFENMYQGYVSEGLPGLLIYHLTSAKSLTRLVRAMGANTAGVGVCFRSSRDWARMTASAGLQTADYTEPDDWVWPQRMAWRVLLHIRSIRVGHLWLIAARQHPDEASVQFRDGTELSRAGTSAST
ncbi:MAG: class I SAM-dependent methyltransferase [Steroidobacteraceae bacterium]